MNKCCVNCYHSTHHLSHFSRNLVYSVLSKQLLSWGLKGHHMELQLCELRGEPGYKATSTAYMYYMYMQSYVHIQILWYQMYVHMYMYNCISKLKQGSQIVGNCSLVPMLSSVRE
jgi:hypothetical protein